MTLRNNVVLQFPKKDTPITVNRKVPIRLANAKYRSREYLTEFEVNQLIGAIAKVGRHGHRDATLIMLGYRHGLAYQAELAILLGGVRHKHVPYLQILHFIQLS